MLGFYQQNFAKQHQQKQLPLNVLSFVVWDVWESNLKNLIEKIFSNNYCFFGCVTALICEIIHLHGGSE